MHEGHSHSCHPLVLEGDEGHIKPLECDAVALRIELICELLLQLPVILLSIHLWEQPGLCCARGWGRGKLPCSALPVVQVCCRQPCPQSPTSSKPQKRQQKMRAQG